MSLTDENLLAFFKALADANRLKILGFLAQRPHSVEELATLLDLRPSTVSHHLAKLSEVGLVSARAESYYNIYFLVSGSLENIAQSLLARDAFKPEAVKTGQDAYDRKIIADFMTTEGRLKSLPAQRKKMEAILRYVVQMFEPGVYYPEKQVNELLGHFHEDTATLRRELVGYHLLSREGGQYWRSDEVESPIKKLRSKQ